MDVGLKMDFYDIDEKLALHPLRNEDIDRIVAINEAARTFAQLVFERTPRSNETDRSVAAIQEAALWAREAILLGHRVTPSRRDRRIAAGCPIQLGADQPTSLRKTERGRNSRKRQG